MKNSSSLFPQSLASGVRGSVEKLGSLAESVSVSRGDSEALKGKFPVPFAVQSFSCLSDSL